ncbi:hypothetical protein CF15_06940 [Pyrodictium occultum]|uniref:Protein kinase domain-containing protein n=1 Tax=Pyrodictium occultum TaxID=2309 RepID=A0A0V8RWL8_PYROC|nr:hypothetical protein [Pyrodictium occultum]KSW12454.1 hypothetical protein CF15_06940 [Pyrodictium occultum]
MARLSLVFHSGFVVSTDSDEWELLDSGGEADIYRARLRGGQSYIVKLYTPKYTGLARPVERIAEMLRRLTRLRRRCGGSIPESLWARGLPVAVGALEDRAVLVFREVEDFTTVSELVNNPELLGEYLERHSLEERRRFAREVLRGLACLDAADIVHVDATTPNAAYGRVGETRGVFLYDYETAGIIGSEDYPLTVLPARDANLLPVEVLAEAGVEIQPPDPGELPIPLQPSRLPRPILSWIAWTPTWYGLQLVALVYSGLSPFHGLPVLSSSYWLEIVEAEAAQGYPGGWPPLSMVDQGYLDQTEYLELSKLWRSLGEDVVEAMYHVFIVDPGERRGMPSYPLSSIF